jgi:chromosome segregation ATPase
MDNNGGVMGLDETSRAIGRLEASQEATKTDVATLKERTERMDAKLDKLLARTNNVRWTIRHWATLIASGSLGGGGFAHVLRKILE